MANRIRMPPAVGVPCFLWCVAGPSSLIYCPKLIRRSCLTKNGPRISVSRSAVTVAYMARNVI